jgi:hypothetical protein
MCSVPHCTKSAKWLHGVKPQNKICSGCRSNAEGECEKEINLQSQIAQKRTQFKSRKGENKRVTFESNAFVLSKTQQNTTQLLVRPIPTNDCQTICDEFKIEQKKSKTVIIYNANCLPMQKHRFV